ncbi:MAG: hypothetical protein GX431_11210 [Bacteroidales bacterium]|nr:hypothetical protein [Bacteroidales bacterium]
MNKINTNRKYGGRGDDDDAWRSVGSTRNMAPLALAEGKVLIRDQSRLI